MNKKIAQLLLACMMSLGLTSITALPAEAVSCDQNTSNANFCDLSSNDNGYTVFGSAGKFATCELTYLGVKLNDGYESVSRIELSGVGKDGKVLPGTVLTASVRMDQECISWQGAYSLDLYLEGKVNPSVKAKEVNSSFTYLKKFSGGFDSYCFTETCGYTLWTFEIAIPNDFKRDLFSIRAVPKSQNPFMRTWLKQELKYTDALSLGDRLNIETSISEVGGRIICFTADASPEAIASQGIESFEFEIVRYESSGQERLLDSGTWQLGVPPGNIRTKNMAYGDASSVVVQGAVMHTFQFTDEERGVVYGCKIRVATKLGPSSWEVKKMTAGRTVISGVVEPLPNVKVLCSKINKKFPGGVAKSAKAKNLGPKTYKKPAISESIYRTNAFLDLDKDGLVCER